MTSVRASAAAASGFTTTHEAPDSPIACSLSAAGDRSRLEDMRALAARALASREPIADGHRLRFTASAETERQLRDFVTAESTCCPFLTFGLATEDDALRLDVTGPAGAQPIIAELFA